MVRRIVRFRPDCCAKAVDTAQVDYSRGKTPEQLSTPTAQRATLHPKASGAVATQAPSPVFCANTTPPKLNGRLSLPTISFVRAIIRQP
jgi:hypothetical protein